MITTFDKTFTPRRDAINAPASIAPSLVSPQAEYDMRSMQTAKDQIRHYRGWNYVAISRNAMKAAQYFPNVSRVVGAGSGGFGRNIDRAQRHHLKQFYGRRLRQGFDDLTPLPESHPLVDLLSRVNSQDWWETFAFETYVMYQLTGALYWWLIPNKLNNGIPAELWLIPTQWIKAKYNRDGKQVAWSLYPEMDEQRKRELPLDQVIWMQNKNPASKKIPLSAVDAGSQWIMNAEAIETSRNKTFKYGIMPPMAFEYDPEKYPTPPEPEVMDRIERKFMAMYAGVDNIGRIASTPPGITLKPVGHKPSEMDYLASGDTARDDVLALHGTPRMAAGLAGDLNRANIWGSGVLWCQNTIMPLHAQLAGFMTEKLAPLFGPDLLVWYDDCTPHDSEEERAEQLLDWQMGAISPEQRAQYRDRPAPEGDAAKKTFVPMGVTPLETFDGPPADTTPPPGGAGSNPGDNGGSPPPDGAAADGLALSGIQHCVHCHELRNALGRPIYLSARQQRVIKLFEQMHAKFERASVADIKRMWGRLQREVVNRIEATANTRDVTPERALPAASFAASFNQTMTRHWLAQMRAGVVFEASMLGIDLTEKQYAPPDIHVDLSPEIVSEIERQLAERQVGVWTKILPSTHRAMQVAITEGIREGVGVKDIANRVGGVLESERVQSLRIARTEATNSLNSGQQLLRTTHGVQVKEWLSTRDGKTRATHRAADSQEVKNNEPFMIGGYEMMFPGDSSRGAPAEEVVNCRCSSAGVVGTFAPEAPKPIIPETRIPGATLQEQLSHPQAGVARGEMLKASSKQQSLDTALKPLRKRESELRKQVERAKKEWLDLRDSGGEWIGALKEYKKLDKKLDDIGREIWTATQRHKRKPIEAILTESKDRMRVTMTPGEPIKTTDSYGKPMKTLKPTKKQNAKIEEAVRFLEGLSSGGDKVSNVVYRTPTKRRAFHRGGGTSRGVYVGDADDVATVVHEIAHAIEQQVPSIQQKTNEFVQMRIARSGSKPIKMSEICPECNYTADEVGNPDDFAKLLGNRRAAYVGKVYKSGATEVLSMGLEELFRDPVRFAKIDPEFFDFLVNVMRQTL